MSKNVMLLVRIDAPNDLSMSDIKKNIRSLINKGTFYSSELDEENFRATKVSTYIVPKKN